MMAFESSQDYRQAVLESFAQHHPYSDGTLKIHYQSLDRLSTTYSELPKPDIMAEVRTVEFHYHMQPDVIANRTAFPHPHGPLSSFIRECPAWYFLGAKDQDQKPEFNILVAHHGSGDLATDYQEMLHYLLSLMASLTAHGFEDVSVKILPSASEPRFPSDASMAELKSLFQKALGTATVVGQGDGSRMEFRPQNLKKW